MDADKNDQSPMDAEDLAIEMDKMDKAQQGKETFVDQAKVEADVATCKKLAAQGKLQEAVDGLLAVEKAGRTAEDFSTTSLACTTILELLYSASEWKQLMEMIQLLSKRRSQLKQAIRSMVRQAMGYIDSTPDNTIRVELIQTLLSLTEGRIFVEIERARLTRLFARMKESEGKIAEATELLQEVAVETYGSMSKTEKISFILEQVRLCLDRGDYVRAQIMARKISPRAFARENLVEEKMEGKPEYGIEGTVIEAAPEGTPNLEELKLQYHGLMIRYYAHHSDYLEMARSYRAILDTPCVEADVERSRQVLAKTAWYCVLSSASSDQRTLLEITKDDKRMENLAALHKLLKGFSGKELLWWRQLSVDLGDAIAAASDVFSEQNRKEDLRLRVTQHNILILSKYYSRITVERLSQMLELPLLEAEKAVSDMVVSGAIAAKMDRPAGIVNFGAKKGAAAALNAWGGNVSRLLELVETSSQAIQKEAMVHKVDLGIAAM